MVASNARRSASTRSAGTSGGRKNGRAYSVRANNSRIAWRSLSVLARLITNGTPGSSGYGSALYCTRIRSEEHTSELQSLRHLVCRLLLAKQKATRATIRLTNPQVKTESRERLSTACSHSGSPSPLPRLVFTLQQAPSDSTNILGVDNPDL